MQEMLLIGRSCCWSWTNQWAVGSRDMVSSQKPDRAIYERLAALFTDWLHWLTSGSSGESPLLPLFFALMAVVQPKSRMSVWPIFDRDFRLAAWPYWLVGRPRRDVREVGACWTCCPPGLADPALWPQQLWAGARTEPVPPAPAGESRCS